MKTKAPKLPPPPEAIPPVIESAEAVAGKRKNQLMAEKGKRNLKASSQNDRQPTGGTLG